MLDRLAFPLIQAPMLGISTRALALAVCNAGGLGSFAAAGSAPAGLEEEAAALRSAADGRPFAINLFVLRDAAPDTAGARRAMELLAPWRAELGLPPQALPNRFAEPFADQFAALLRAAPPVASFTFGVLTAEEVAALHARDCWVIGTATTVAEALAWQAAGADAICAQGFEAGGHRGHFLADVEESLVGTMALVPQVRAAVPLPVIAAGGIMDGAGIAAALALGASAVQLGTAFLLAHEAATSPAARGAIAEAPHDATRLTRAFSGRHARGIANRFMREMAEVADNLPAYPVQNALTAELRAAAAKAGRADMLSLWAGQGVRSARAMPAAALVAALMHEAEVAATGLAARFSRGKSAAGTH
jgi:nitronate monooxygenase